MQLDCMYQSAAVGDLLFSVFGLNPTIIQMHFIGTPHFQVACHMDV